MNIEFHYSLTYLIALLAGFSPEDAYIIAYSSQYVDDNSTLIQVRQKDGNSYFSCPTQVYCPRYTANFTNTIYPVYHFIPGDIEVSSRCRHDGMRHPLLVTPGSRLAEKMLRWALSTDDLYVIGIISHAFADTWTHQNFTGTLDIANAMQDTLVAKLMPNIGHADVLDVPDLMAAQWQDSRIKSSQVQNRVRCAQAAQRLFMAYARYLGVLRKSLVKRRANFIRRWVEDVVRFSSKMSASSAEQTQYRLMMYQVVALEVSDNVIPEYDPSQWLNQAVKRKYRYYPQCSFVWLAPNEYQQSHWYRFQQAAKRVKGFVLPAMEGRWVATPDSHSEGRAKL